MSEQDNSNLFPLFPYAPKPGKPGVLTVAEGFAFLWAYHFKDLPSGVTFNSNRKAWCRTTGHIYLHDLIDLHVKRHCESRKNGHGGRKPAGNQTLRHDIKLLVILLNKCAEWKQKRYTLSGFDFENLQLPWHPPTKGIKRPKATPRRKIVSSDDFALYCEHAHEDLKDRLYFLMDTAASPVDLMNLEPNNYDMSMNCIRFIRHKTLHSAGVEVILPVTDRCKRIILKAIKEERKYILKWKGYESEHRKQYEQARWASGVFFQIGRDLRKTNLNETIKAADGDIKPAQKIAGHVSPETTWNHYFVDHGSDLRPFVEAISSKYNGRRGPKILRMPVHDFSHN